MAGTYEERNERCNYLATRLEPLAVERSPLIFATGSLPWICPRREILEDVPDPLETDSALGRVIFATSA